MRKGKTQKTKNINMLEGSLWDKILIFALPLALTGILQQLFNAADVAVVGSFVSAEAMAAVGSNAPVIGLFVNLFIGVSVGANVVIARYTGQMDKEGIKKGVHTAVCLAIVFGIALALIGQFASEPMLRAMSVPDNVLPMAVLYLRIYMGGMPVILLYNFESAIYRSQGDTRTPLICLVTSGIVNVILNLFFILVCGMSAEGVAIATVIANVVSSGMMFIGLLKRNDDIRLDIKKIAITKKTAVVMLKIGLPAGLQGMVFSVSNILIQSAINNLGTEIMAASSAAFNIEIAVFYIVNAFGQASTTFIGQNFGAGKIKRCGKVTLTSGIIGVVFGMAFSLLLLLFGKPLLMLFNTDETVLSFGFIRLMYILPFEGINVLMEIFSGSMRGYGTSLPPAVISLFAVCGIRIFWVMTVFTNNPTFAMLMNVYPISWGVAASLLAVAYFATRRKIVQKYS